MKELNGKEKLKRLKVNNSILPYLVFLVTVSKDNADSLHEIFKTCENLNADAVICYYSWFTNEEIGQAHTELMENRLDITPSAWKGYLLSTDEIDIDAVQQNVKKIKPPVKSPWKPGPATSTPTKPDRNPIPAGPLPLINKTTSVKKPLTCFRLLKSKGR